MRIAMLLENSPYPQDVRVRSEAESLVAAGHMVAVLAPAAAGQPQRELVEGVRVRRYRLPAARPGAAGYLLEYAVANAHLYRLGIGELLRGANVVHLHNPPDTLFGVALLARALGRKAVFDHHDLAPELFEAKFGAGPLASVLRLCERLSLRASHRVLAANESHREIAIQRGGLSPERVAVIRNGPPARAFAEAGDGRGGVLRAPRLLFLGCMESQDGVDQLLPLLEHLNREHNLRPQLTLVGDGSLQEELEKDAAARGLDGQVHFTGRVPHTEVPALLAAADICLDPAPCSPLNHRSTMIKIAEYLTARRPTVAFPLLETRRTGGEAISFAECDGLDSFAAQIAALASQPERRAALARIGADRARSLGWESSETALLAAYHDLDR